jgi:hypothetical protein
MNDITMSWQLVSRSKASGTWNCVVWYTEPTAANFTVYTIKMNAVASSKTLAPTHQTTWRDFLEDCWHTMKILLILPISVINNTSINTTVYLLCSMKLHVSVLKDCYQAKYDRICTSKAININPYILQHETSHLAVVLFTMLKQYKQYTVFVSSLLFWNCVI